MFPVLREKPRAGKTLKKIAKALTDEYAGPSINSNPIQLWISSVWRLVLLVEQRSYFLNAFFSNFFFQLKKPCLVVYPRNCFPYFKINVSQKSVTILQNSYHRFRRPWNGLRFLLSWFISCSHYLSGVNLHVCVSSALHNRYMSLEPLERDFGNIHLNPFLVLSGQIGRPASG